MHVIAAKAVALQGGAEPGVQDLPAADRAQRQGAGRGAGRSAASGWSRAAPTTT